MSRSQAAELLQCNWNSKTRRAWRKNRTVTARTWNKTRGTGLQNSKCGKRRLDGQKRNGRSTKTRNEEWIWNSRNLKRRLWHTTCWNRRTRTAIEEHDCWQCMCKMVRLSEADMFQTTELMQYNKNNKTRRATDEEQNCNSKYCKRRSYLQNWIKRTGRAIVEQKA